MPAIKRDAVVPYTQKQMYTLVDEIEAYSCFIPWCIKSEEHSRSSDQVQGILTFASGGIEKSFSTLNRLQPYKMIELCLVDGPFKHLYGFWRFEVISDHSSRVSLDLEFEFSSRIFAVLLGSVFERMASTLVDSFTKRAAEVYTACPPQT